MLTSRRSALTGSSNRSVRRSRVEKNSVPSQLATGFFHHLLDNGVYFPPSQFEAGFISTAHSEADIDKASAVIQSWAG